MRVEPRRSRIAGAARVRHAVGDLLPRTAAERRPDGPAPETLPRAPARTAGALEGNVAQIFIQIKGIAWTLGYDAIASFILFKVIDLVIGLRVTEEQEREGLDQALHGESVQ